ncbi:transglutaminase family protein [Fusibacter sp. 3D3]|uniref:transglutaminase-like domain-containing protein n=1 Tax=Fusibacter sp. 3D3 TaxID=1048380 RepID=UPI000852A123|nr:transglutaminase-like domain-containing protein [Fusibacter sp. 3D3]GAU79827.1 transglutaminase-like enzyme [Fusibacter sp. 3D3]
MKKMVLFSVLFFIASMFNFSFGQDLVNIDTTNEGVVGIEYNAKNLEDTRVVVQKGNEKYVYRMHSNNAIFPLQMGNGIYTVTLLEHVNGTKYKVISSEDIDVTLKQVNTVFLSSIQRVQWDDTMVPIIKAKELVAGLNGDRAKVEVIYDYIVNGIAYDYQMLSSVSNTYLPNIQVVFDKKSGICYDYASLFAAMLRSVDVPTKLVMGHTTNLDAYHAWNEVYVESEAKWIIIDTTIDAQYIQKNKTVEMEKNKRDYTSERIY